jgi:sugar/nucleoside kinase (ribokinase family)
VQKAKGKTFRWGGRYSENFASRETLFTELGVFQTFDPKIPTAYRDSEWVFLANIQPQLQRGVLEQAKAPRFSAMDTMNFWIAGEREALGKTLEKVGGLIINDEEARQLTGESNLVRAAEQIHGMGPRVVIVKRGENGALLFDQHGIFSAPAFPLREVRDPTGAGDTFAGGFMGSLAESGELGPDALRRAVIYGSTLASFCVERFGLERFKTLDRAHVDARFEEFRRLTRF